LVFAPLAVASFVLVWVIGWWSLRPLARASREAAAIGPTNPFGHVSTDMLPHEIRSMVDAVNGALARLDDAYAAQRRFTADAAHELRTPLAVLNLRLQRAKLDAAVDWPAVERDLADMNRTVGQLVTKLAANPRQSSLARALIELGRLEHTWSSFSPPNSCRQRQYVASVTPIARIASATGVPCPVSTSTCRSLATISSGARLFLRGIRWSSSSAEADMWGGPLQGGQATTASSPSCRSSAASRLSVHRCRNSHASPKREKPLAGLWLGNPREPAAGIRDSRRRTLVPHDAVRGGTPAPSAAGRAERRRERPGTCRSNPWSCPG
jgi:hypothetical protein